MPRRAPASSYHLNPDLPVIKDGWKGNLMVGKQYVNHGDREPERSMFRTILKWMTTKNPQAEEKRIDTFVPEISSDRSYLDATHDIMVWLGHASFFIRLNGTTILIDPCFRSFPSMPRRVPVPFPVEALPTVDHVLVSHNHRDHMDLPTLREVFGCHQQAQALVPLGSGKALGKVMGKAMENTTGNHTGEPAGKLTGKPTGDCREAGWFQRFSPGNGIDIFFLPARHWCMRRPGDRNTMLWGSFIIKALNEERSESRNTTIYFAGDTGVGDHFREISDMFPDIDYALLPIGAYKPDFVMKHHHLSPQEAVEAFRSLGAKHMIPMHYGTYDLSDEPPGEPIRELQIIEREKDLTGRLHYPRVGEGIDILKSD